MIENMLVWNLRGLGCAKTRLCQLVKKYNVVIVAILEHFSEVSKMKHLALSLGLTNFSSNSDMDGKLWVFWRASCDFELVCTSNQMTIGWFHNGAGKFFVTFVYAKCSKVERCAR